MLARWGKAQSQARELVDVHIYIYAAIIFKNLEVNNVMMKKISKIKVKTRSVLGPYQAILEPKAKDIISNTDPFPQSSSVEKNKLFKVHMIISLALRVTVNPRVESRLF